MPFVASPLRRVILRISLILLLGAIINVVVAWAAAAFSMQQISKGPLIGPWSDVRMMHPSWLVTIERRSIGFSLKTLRMKSAPQQALIPEAREVFVFSADLPFGYDEWLLGLSVGWPVRCLECTCLSDSSSECLEAGLEIPRPLEPVDHTRRRLPLLPVWPGFAINKIFYATIVWVLFAFSGVLRRRIRARRRRCITCGYDLRGRGRSSESNVCPECGTHANDN